MTRDLTVKCRLCGCLEVSEIHVGDELDARTFELSRGTGALRRFGGCLAPCLCHDEFRLERESPFTIEVSSPRAFALPRRLP